MVLQSGCVKSMDSFINISANSGPVRLLCKWLITFNIFMHREQGVGLRAKNGGSDTLKVPQLAPNGLGDLRESEQDQFVSGFV